MKIIIQIICFHLACTCIAETWHVDDDGKADFSSIQEAINVASNGDFIVVHSGVYF